MKLVGLAGLALAAAIAHPASAQPQSAQRLPNWNVSHTEEGDPAVNTLYRLATCAAGFRADAAEALVRSERGSAEEQAAAAALLPRGHDFCLTGGATRFRIRSRDALRGAVAEAIYNRGRMRPRSDAPLPGAASPALSDHPREVIACAVARAPMAAHDILQVNYGSPNETRRLRQLDPALLECLPPSASLRASRLAVRTYISGALLSAARRHPELFVNA